MERPKAVIFDLDDTLAESFRPPKAEVVAKVKSLLEYLPVAIMTGAGFKRMEEQFLGSFLDSAHLDRFYLFPNSSAQCLVHRDTDWTTLYNLALTIEERERIKRTIRETLDRYSELRDIPHWGERLFDREAQVAYTPTGSEASLEVKRTWDPDGSKRAILWETLSRALPDCEVLLGGLTTIDITRKGINKSYGVKWFAEHLDIAPAQMYYVGDAFYEGGNDRIVIPTGVVTRAVSGPEETPAVLDELLAACAA